MLPTYVCHRLLQLSKVVAESGFLVGEQSDDDDGSDMRAHGPYFKKGDAAAVMAAASLAVPAATHHLPFDSLRKIHPLIHFSPVLFSQYEYI